MRSFAMLGLLLGASIACAPSERDAAATRDSASAAVTALTPSSPPIDTVPRALPAGAQIEASIQQPISSARNKSGDSVRAVVRLNVMDDRGRVIVPGGSDLVLTIGRIAAAEDARGTGVVALTLRSLSIGAARYTPRAEVGAVPLTRDATAHPPADRDALVAAGTPVTIRLVQQLNITTK